MSHLDNTNPPTTTPISPKVILSTVGSLAAGIVLAILLAVQDGSIALAGLPTWASAIITVILPPVITAITGYAKSDPLRDVGNAALNGEPIDPV